VQDKCLKGRIVLVTVKTKHVLTLFGVTPGAISRNFFMAVCNVVPHLHSIFHPNQFGFGEVITKKPFCDPQS